MKINTKNIIEGILYGEKLNKIADKETKAALLKDYLALRKVSNAAENDKNEIARKFQEDWREELEPVQELRNAKKAVVGHDKYLEAEADANRAIAEIFNADVDVEVATFKAEHLYDAELWGPDDTPAQIANSVDFLIEHGLAE